MTINATKIVFARQIELREYNYKKNREICYFFEFFLQAIIIILVI